MDGQSKHDLQSYGLHRGSEGPVFRFSDGKQG